MSTILLHFLKRWKTLGPYNYYANGSYVLTQHRVNGFEPEASYLANLLGIVYLPIMVGITTTNQAIFKKIKKLTYKKVLIY